MPILTLGVRYLHLGFGTLLGGESLYPVLSPSDGYYDQTANWADLQLSVIQGKMTAEQAAATYQKDWKTP